MDVMWFLCSHVVLLLCPTTQRFSNGPPEWTSWVPVLGTLVAFGKNPIAFVLEGRRKVAHSLSSFLLLNLRIPVFQVR